MMMITGPYSLELLWHRHPDMSSKFLVSPIDQICAAVQGQTSLQPSPPPPVQQLTQQSVLTQLLSALQGRPLQPPPPPPNPLEQLCAALQGCTSQPPPPPPTQEPHELLQQLLKNPAILQQLATPQPSLAGQQQYGLMEMATQKSAGQSLQKPLLQNIRQGNHQGRVVHV